MHGQQPRGIIDIQIDARPIVAHPPMDTYYDMGRSFGRKSVLGTVSGMHLTADVASAFGTIAISTRTTGEAMERARKTLARYTMRMHDMQAASVRASVMKRCSGNRRRQFRKQNRRDN